MVLLFRIAACTLFEMWLSAAKLVASLTVTIARICIKGEDQESWLASNIGALSRLSFWLTSYIISVTLMVLIFKSLGW